MTVVHVRRRVILWTLGLCVSLVTVVTVSMTVPADSRNANDGRIFVLIGGANPEIRSMDSDGAEVHKVFDLPSGPVQVGLDASSDGSFLAYSEAELEGADSLSRINVVKTDGSAISTPLETAAENRFLTGPSFSPSASRVIFTDSTFGPAGEVHALARIGANGEGFRRLTSSDDPGCSFASWSPNGSRIACIDQSQRRQRIVVTDRRALEFDVLFRAGRRVGLTSVIWSPDSDSLVFSMFDESDRFPTDDLWSISASGSDLTRITSSRRMNESDAAFSPDGTRLAVVQGTQEAAGFLVVMDLDGTDRTQVGEAGDHVTSVSWAPPSEV